jgi:hypothetical protein
LLKASKMSQILVHCKALWYFMEQQEELRSPAWKRRKVFTAKHLYQQTGDMLNLHSPAWQHRFFSTPSTEQLRELREDLVPQPALFCFSQLPSLTKTHFAACTVVVRHRLLGQQG